MLDDDFQLQIMRCCACGSRFLLCLFNDVRVSHCSLSRRRSTFSELTAAFSHVFQLQAKMSEVWFHTVKAIYLMREAVVDTIRCWGELEAVFTTCSNQFSGVNPRFISTLLIYKTSCIWHSVWTTRSLFCYSLTDTSRRRWRGLFWCVVFLLSGPAW